MKLSNLIKSFPTKLRSMLREAVYFPTRRIRIYLFFMFLLICGCISWSIKASAIHNSELQEGIAANIIRFHVIANSDSDQDQALKLKVKDDLVAKLSPLLSNATSIEQARAIITENLELIRHTAEASIVSHGYYYPVRVTLESCYFPLKTYGNCSFPPGKYEALRVRIGAAEGKNWWCVMFPPLCFVDQTYSIVDEKTNQKLKRLLTEEEYDSLVHQKTPVKIKFKLLEKLKKLIK